MNTKETSEFLNFFKSIDPLNFDIAFVNDYLADIYKGNIPQALIAEVACLYQEDVENIKRRLEYVEIIGKGNLFFDEEEDYDECDKDD